ncbi:hypothetical protein M9458_051210, partial [Cirrhinus mrigala]
EDDPNLTLLCPVRVLRIYLELSSLSVMENSRRGRLSPNKGSPTGLWMRSVRLTRSEASPAHW